MEPFLEREEATTTSKLVGILPGDPPRLNLVDHAAGRDGVKRHFAQQVPVLDGELFARLQTEVKIGEHIRATIANEYTEKGSRVYLAGFQKVDDKTTNATNGMKNGSHGITPISIGDIQDKTERY